MIKFHVPLSLVVSVSSKDLFFRQHFSYRENCSSPQRIIFSLENTSAGGKISALRFERPLFTKISVSEMGRGVMLVSSKGHISKIVRATVLEAITK